MSSVRTKGSAPELIVRRTAHALGYRFRLHRKDLPGTPDLVFPGRKKIIFVHGCFWHSHKCRKGRRPASNTDFWNTKIDRNTKRDRAAVSALKRAGWSVLVLWECETKASDALSDRLRRFLGDVK